MNTKIATKILDLMRLIPEDQALDKFNETLVVQKLIPQTKYQIVESKEHITREGVVWQVVTVSCELTIIDTESGESLVYTALGAGMDTGSLAIVKAQEMAFNRACLGVLNISSTVIVTEPEIIVETSETKLISTINALWKWTPAELTTWVTTRFNGRFLDQLNVSELSVLKSELLNYGGKN